MRLVCWDESAAAAHANTLSHQGFRVIADSLRGASGLIGRVREAAPDVVLFDLDRLPSHSREVAIALRNGKSTRALPLVFAGGLPAKRDRMQAELPDALYCSWDRVVETLQEATLSAPLRPVTPVAPGERYPKQSLARKLGLAADTAWALVPADGPITPVLSGLLPDLVVKARVDQHTTLALYPVHSRPELAHAFAHAARHLPAHASLWILSPKQSGRLRCDFNQNDVRAHGLEAGFVDYKVCSVDADWSGLKFSRRKDAQRRTM